MLPVGEWSLRIRYLSETWVACACAHVNHEIGKPKMYFNWVSFHRNSLSLISLSCSIFQRWNANLLWPFATIRFFFFTSTADHAKSFVYCQSELVEKVFSFLDSHVLFQLIHGISWSSFLDCKILNLAKIGIFGAKSWHWMSNIMGNMAYSHSDYRYLRIFGCPRILIFHSSWNLVKPKFYWKC